MNIPRILPLQSLLSSKSFFLFGARSTGKTSLIKDQLGDDCLLIDLLDNRSFFRLSQDPTYLESMIREAGKSLVVIDEVQKLPTLLDEVHRLLETLKIKFLLTGSSARRLKRGNANMLGGRAWEAQLYPLVSHEVPHFTLDTFLLYGGLPHVYTSAAPAEELRAYASLYLREEILAEGIIRNLPRFSRLLKVAALSNAQIINFTKLASDVGCAPSTAIEHFRILEDTLIGFFVEPWHRSRKRKEIARGKFYFFDTGVANTLAEISALDRGSDLFGRSLEHLVALELRAYLSYRRTGLDLQFWATTTGLEVDFVIADLLAVEVKATARVTSRDLKGLVELEAEQSIKSRILVSLDTTPAIIEGIRCLPLSMFLKELWGGMLL